MVTFGRVAGAWVCHGDQVIPNIFLGSLLCEGFLMFLRGPKKIFLIVCLKEQPMVGPQMFWLQMDHISSNMIQSSLNHNFVICFSFYEFLLYYRI